MRQTSLTLAIFASLSTLPHSTAFARQTCGPHVYNVFKETVDNRTTAEIEFTLVIYRGGAPHSFSTIMGNKNYTSSIGGAGYFFAEGTGTGIYDEKGMYSSPETLMSYDGHALHEKKDVRFLLTKAGNIQIVDQSLHTIEEFHIEQCDRGVLFGSNNKHDFMRLAHKYVWTGG